MGQHFVSQHYLRQFRIGTTEMMCIAKIKPFQWIGPGGIKGQCQEDNFYGKDSAIDKAYTEIESQISPAVVSVAQTLTWTEDELKAIRMLAASLSLRTRKSVDSHKILPRMMADEVLRVAIERGELPPPPGGYRKGLIDFKGVPGELIISTVICFLEAATLRLKLLLAPKGTAFITSDHPAAAMNQFAADSRSSRSFVGFAQAGFQLFLPISPRVTAFFYDPTVYKVGGRGTKTIPVTVQDVELLNALQIQSAEECVYCHDAMMESAVEALCTRYSALRVNTSESVKVYPTAKPKEELIHVQNLPVRLPRPLGFISYVRHVKATVGQRRDPAYSKLITMLIDDLEKNPNGGDIGDRMEKIVSSLASLG